MLMDIHELKGIDFSTRYFGPSKGDFIFESPTIPSNLVRGKIVNQIEISDNYSQLSLSKSQSNSSKRYKWRISCIKDLFSDSQFNVEKLYEELTVNLKFNKIRAIYLKNGIKTKNKHLINSSMRFISKYRDENNENHVNGFKKELSKYINVENADIKNLMHDLNYNHNSDFRNLAYELILKEFDLDLSKLPDLKHIIESKMMIDSNQKLFSSDNNDFNDNVNLGFKLSYIHYLMMVNSVQNNSMDTKHYFDNNGDVSPYVYFYEDYGYYSVNFLKNLALSENHIIDGKGIGVLKFNAKVKDIQKVLEDYALKNQEIEMYWLIVFWITCL